ncbi:hypothetical protein LSTR_LSTR001406 [Laodelphax striatellus]|uniref:Suppressor of forked domain-containing protein n=1 Tax=Laodelphax striatellus TaxID=195883 RepID=A0A482XBD8_LAOST|nr:hypothetical protein LSTR_LSTR001406 [Laodelphax striatellus]
MTTTEEKTEVDWGSEKLNKAQEAIKENQWDLEAWSMLIREAQTKWINDVRPFFEQLVTAFPSTGRYWKLYIEQEMKGRNFERVEKLFQRCLMKVLNIDLWKLYLAYVKETKAALPTYKEKMAQAYDFALEKIGMDIQSYSIWNDYVQFLQSVEAIGSYAENQKISAVRKVYQRGVVNPMMNIEAFWKDYMAFEQGINPIIAEKMSMERSRYYMNARRVAKEFEAVTRGLNKNIPSVPPTGHLDELKQSNPLRSRTQLCESDMFALEQCCCVWTSSPISALRRASSRTEFENSKNKKIFRSFLQDVNSAKLFSDEAANVFERATSSTLKHSMLLYFAYADFEEGRMKYDKVHQIYSKFLEIQEIDPTLAYIQYMKFARRAEGIKSARNVFKKAREDSRSKFHIFVSAALMEYYCSKDKNIAFRIFELGLKKFSDSPQYVLCYIDYLSHLNEDNNTRVLFERVLSSGSLEPEKSVEIWNKFLEFESNIGDLTSIVKVEKRRSAVLGKIAEFEGKETAQLVDRYKFLDLYPCSAAELRSIGYNEVTATVKQHTMHAMMSGGPSRGFLDSGFLDDHLEPQNNLPRPDTSQMIPFKPKAQAYWGEHPVPGGAFPFPPAAGQLCTLLPPPLCFHGPFVAVDKLIDVFSKIQLPDTAPAPITDNGCDTKLFDLAKSVHWVVDNEDAAAARRKRRLNGGGGAAAGDDSDDDEMMGAPPANDIYRQRQQKRVK